MMKIWCSLFIFSACCLSGGWCLKDVRLTAEPSSTVEKGSNVNLHCRYDLENNELYMVTWFRGNHQVFRYSPSYNPNFKFFPMPGVEVDKVESNCTVLALGSVDLHASGKWSCEVTTESPSFSTATSYLNVTVIVLSKLDPVLWIGGDKEEYRAGDVLQANCTSPPSRPPANITFYLNKLPVINEQDRSRVKELWQSALGQPSLFKSWGWLETELTEFDVRHGLLMLECSTNIAGHRRTTFRQLKAATSDPSPQRVRMTSGVGSTSLTRIIVLITIINTFILES